MRFTMLIPLVFLLPAILALSLGNAPNTTGNTSIRTYIIPEFTALHNHLEARLSPTDNNSIPTPTHLEPIFTALSVYIQRRAPPVIYCETTAGSPLPDDVRAAANELKKRTGTLTKSCRQKNPWGSKCTQMKDIKTAAIGICGGAGSQLPCKDAGLEVEKIVERCRKNIDGVMRVGGYIQYDWGRVVVYHS